MKRDYLVSVEPNEMSGKTIASHRLTDKTEDYKDGFVAALEIEYSNYNKYRVNCITI